MRLAIRYHLYAKAHGHENTAQVRYDLSHLVFGFSTLAEYKVFLNINFL